MTGREARLLALENRVFRLVPPDLERRIRAAEERQLQMWQVGSTDQVTTTPPGPVATGACGDPIDFTLPVADWYYGSASVSYRGIIGGSYTWWGLKQVTTPAGGSCASVSTTIRYELLIGTGTSPDTNILVYYEADATTHCPVAGTFPIDYPFNTSQTMGGITFHACSPFYAQVSTHTSGIYNVSGTGTVTIGSP